jgi:hypothetical protein
LVAVVLEMNRIPLGLEVQLEAALEQLNFLEATGLPEPEVRVELAVVVLEQQGMAETGRELLAEQGQP